MEQTFVPQDWALISKEDYLKYGIGINEQIKIISAFKHKNYFIELIDCNGQADFVKDVIVEYYALIADKQTQKELQIEPKWLFRYEIEAIEITLTVVQSMTDDKVFSASLFFTKNQNVYGINIIGVTFPLKEFEYLTSSIAIGIEQLVKNI